MRTIGLGLFVLMLSNVALAAKDYRFEYTDEELLSAEELFEKINTSVARYCRDINDIRNLRSIQICRQDLVAVIIDEIGHPRLTAYADGGKSSPGKS